MIFAKFLNKGRVSIVRENKSKKVFVGISGGVDSSVSAHLLIKAGYDVTGVFIRTWTPEWIECTWREERRDAMRVCAHLDIPYLECDAEDVYKKGVADYMIEEYRLGRVPNPDVMCNREVKFGIFWEFAKAHGADFIATGHYAQNKSEDRVHKLLVGKDESKDQSYFLYRLNQSDLSHTLLPIGHMEKSEVRNIAMRAGLFTGNKKDSQGVCFLGPLDMKDFLGHYIKSEKGIVLDEQGVEIGEHEGALFFALGERHGFTITKKTNQDTRYYVVSKDITKNTITVSHEPKPLDNTKDIKIINTNWISGVPEGGKKLYAQIRYHGELHPAVLSKIENNSAVILFEDDKPLVSSGQSIVMYENGVCLGGGIVA